MPKKVTRKSKKKQRRESPARIDIFAAAFYWIVKTVLLFIEWWLTH